MPNPDQFHKAAYFGELAKVKRMLAEGIDVNGSSSYKSSPLQGISAANILRVGTYSVILLLLEAGRDAQRATRLKAEAKELEARGDNAGAGVAYAKVAALYAKHEKLERVLEYYWVGIDMVGYNAMPAEYRPILVAHYRAKRLEFLDKAYVCLERLGMRYPTPESIKAHAAVLEDLAGLREIKDAKFYVLIARVAQILMKEPIVAPVSLAAVDLGLAAISVSSAAAGGAGAKRTSDVSTLGDLSDHEAGEGEGVEESESVALLAAAGAGDKPPPAAGMFGMRQRKAAVSVEAKPAETVLATAVVKAGCA